MAFTTLATLLNQIQRKPAWQNYHRYSAIVTHWKTVVPAKFASKTRPMGIRRQILWVGTESAAIAQHLTLQRYTILKPLNRLLDEPLNDIHFSSVYWTVNPPQTNLENQQFPSSPLFEIEDIKRCNATPEEAFQGWAEIIRQRSHQFPLCPLCQSPLLPLEEKRWSMCGYCHSCQISENSVGV